MRSQQEQHHACQIRQPNDEPNMRMQGPGSVGPTYLQKIRHEIPAQIRHAASAHVVSLQQIRDAVETEAGETPPAETLEWNNHISPHLFMISLPRPS